MQHICITRTKSEKELLYPAHSIFILNGLEICIKRDGGLIHSHASKQEHLGWMVFFSGPSRGCDAIRSSNSDGLRWLLMERIRKRSAPVDESHRQWPITKDLCWAVPSSGWVGSNATGRLHFFKALLCLMSLSLLLNYSLLTSQIACLHKRHCYK